MNSLAKKLLQVMADCSYVQKDAKNEAQKYNYASASAVLEKVNGSLVKHGIITTTEIDVVSSSHQEMNNKSAHYVIVKTKITLMDTDTKDTLITYGMGGGLDYGDKAIMKAQTAALKYAWMSCLNISTGDDPEADETIEHHEKSSIQKVPVYKNTSNGVNGSANVFAEKYKQVKDKNEYFAVLKHSNEYWKSFTKQERDALTHASNEAKLRLGLQVQ